MTYEQIEKALFDLKCINGAMYFGCVETPCSGRETGECCQNEQTWEEAEAELKSFLKRSFIKYLQEQQEIVKSLAFGLSPDQRGRKWVDLEDLIRLYQAQIKELEACK